MAAAREVPGFPMGALMGALLAAPLTAILFLGHRIAGLPFAPFDLFDWAARALPGPVVTLGIDAIVAALRALGVSDLSSAAKTAEQMLAIASAIVVAALVAGALFALLRRARRARAVIAGLILGALFGALALATSLSVSRIQAAPPLASALWFLAVFSVWGASLGWSFRRMTPPKAFARESAAKSEVEVVDRRTFILRVGAASAVITLTGAGLGSLVARRGAHVARGEPWSATSPLPNADATTEPVRGTRPELTPVADHYRIDINTIAPVVSEEAWRLGIGGLVERPRAWTLAALRTREPLHQFVTLSCISNPLAGDLIGTQRWTGVPLSRLLDEVGLRPEASHLRIRSVDGFHETVAIDEVMADERIMLTYAWDGLPLPAEHGFPLRIYIPDRYGMKQPKWIESIEAIDHDEEGYWVRRGWDREARMKATSVIDTIGVDMMIAEANGAMRIPIGGIAHAGARGISRVEVRIDGGAWEPAALREPLSDKTWVLWRYEWPFSAGRHTFAVRCFDGTGTPQIERRSPVRPDGATGLHRDSVMF